MKRTTEYAARTLLLVLLAALWSATAVHAQSSTVAYQGYLTDADGTPLEGEVDLDFALYDAATDGTMMWNESHTGVAVNEGVFSVMLGSDASFDGVDFGGSLYLGITVDGGDELVPRVPLGAAPASLFAHALADGAAVRSLNGITDDVTLQAGDNVSISEEDGTLTIAASAEGGFALPFDGVNDSNDPGLRLINNGTGFGINVSSDGVGALSAGGTGEESMGIFASAVGINPAISAFTSGSGNAVQISTSGSGNALYAYQGEEGTGRAGHFAIQNPNNSANALHAETAGTGIAGQFRITDEDNNQPALLSRTYGIGHAGRFDNFNSNSTASTLLVETNGEGPAALFRNTHSENVDATLKVESNNSVFGLHSLVEGDCCVAGYFEVVDPNSSGITLWAKKRGLGTATIVEAWDESDGLYAFVQSEGTGRAGVFDVLNPDNTANAVEMSTEGSGDALYAYQTEEGTGRAAHFEVLNEDNPNAAVFATANSNTLAAPTFHATHTGRGTAGRFEVTEPDGPGSAVYGMTRGPGVAMHGSSEGNGSLAVGVWAHAASSSDAVPLRVSQDGAGDDLAVFQATTGVNQARIDRTGKGFFNGGTQTGGADLAEAFEVEGSVAAYEPGDVLVISTRTDRTVEKSSTPNSAHVVGVYATKPGVLLSERAIDDPHDDTVPMGVVGVIPTKVTAENGPIRRGDLLVTGSTPGHAMKAGDNPAAGTMIGKALQNFDGPGTGRIKVLVNVK